MIRNILNTLIIKVFPYIPLPIVRNISKRYVAGESLQYAIQTVRDLNSCGYSVTLDILGEHTDTIKKAKEITDSYIKIYNTIDKLNLDCNISIKLSHIGLDINKDILNENFLLLLDKAKELDNFLRIDMENSQMTEDTLDLYRSMKNKYLKVGPVIQAYLYRSYSDLQSLHELGGLNFRLCKGIYNESSDVAYKDKEKINKNFIKLMTYAFKNNIYICIATHDITLIKSAYQLINQFKIANNMFEFQTLYGVPMHGWLQKHLKNKYKVRIYVPFGDDWYQYSFRRIKENPNLANYIIKNYFKKAN